MPNRKKKTTRKKKRTATKHGNDVAVKRKLCCVPCKKYNIKYNNKGGVQRIFSPLKLIKESNQIAKPTKLPPQNPYRYSGLSPKEKSYIICSCQTKFTRYLKLKQIAAKAVKECKIFTIYGCCSAVRRALLERGWIEKIPPNRMNLSKIRNGTVTNTSDVHNELERLLLSNFVEKHDTNFTWYTQNDRDTNIDMSKINTSLVNKLKIDALWTSKQGLCYSMKRDYWFYIEDVAEVNGPRSYDSNDIGEIDDFIKDYKITACTSLLKWVMSMVANQKQVFVESGHVSLNVIVFALNRCKEYLFRKQNKDIDRNLPNINSGQWNGFLSKYYRIIAKEDFFQPDKENKLPLYMGYAKFLLKEMVKYRCQLSCEGCHNIWIIKPAHCSRGRGIRMASKLGVITNLLNKANAKYVIQKYIEEPLLIHETKFDIRQYYLITSTYPLVIWMYTDCYLKFSTQKYNLKNYHESIHLTNNAVQKKYTNCEGRHWELPQNNMWDSEKYKQYLDKIGKNRVWDNIIYPGMRKSIIGIMLSCQDTLSVSKNRFELYGCDFILDKEYKPWLIEINSCPDLNHTTPVTAKICPAVVSDIIKVVIDHANNPKSPTGNFECIYRQPMTIPRYCGAADLVVRGFALPTDYFYKGNIEIKESYNNADISSERDIKAILNKLKQFYDAGPETHVEDCYSNKDESEESKCSPIAINSPNKTQSDIEINIAATVIVEQLDELLQRITSAQSSSSKSGHKCKLKSIESVKTVMEMKSLLKKSYHCFTCADSINASKSFTFSKLDDGPLGKASIGGFNSIKHIIDDVTSGKNDGHEINNSFDEVSSKSHNEILQLQLKTVTKIIAFMKEKEKEYLSDLQKFR